MNIYIRVFGLFFICITSFVAYPQNVTERIILTAESNEAAKNLYYSIGLNQSGDYGFVILKDKSEYFVSGTDTVGPFPVHSHINSVHFSTKVRSSYMIELDSTTNREFYIKNEHNPRYYGKYYGEVIDFEQYDPDFVVIVKTDDTINVFFNDNLLAKLDYKKKDEFDIWNFECNGGNIVYKVRKNNKEYFYCNYKLIDSTDEKIGGFAVNEKGDYIYTVYYTDSSVSPAKNFSYLHTKDTSIGPVRKIYNLYVSPEGGTCAYSVKDGYGEFIVNNRLYIYDTEKEKYEDDFNNYGLYVRDSTNFLQFIKSANGCILNVNGVISYRNYDRILCPNIDENGDYSFFGIRNYYLYKCTNGTEDTVPLSKYGVRAYPIYISPEGEYSYYYFDNNDSIFVYMNDSLLFKTFSSGNSFYSLSDVMYPGYRDEFKFRCNDLIYIKVDTTAYFIYKGHLSKPLPHTCHMTNEKDEGKILSGRLSSNGFYVIQALEKGTLFAIVNNRCYEFIYNVDKFFKDYVFFDGKELVFYTLSGNKIIRYAINEK